MKGGEIIYKILSTLEDKTIETTDFFESIFKKTSIKTKITSFTALKSTYWQPNFLLAKFNIINYNAFQFLIPFPIIQNKSPFFIKFIHLAS